MMTNQVRNRAGECAREHGGTIEMTKQFWVGLIGGIIISGIVGGLIGVSMVGKKATVAPSELEALIVNQLKALRIPEAPTPAAPIEMTTENLVEGGEHYNHHCAVCHDLEGDADSEFAKAFNPPVADLTSEHVQSYSDGQLKWIVDNGIRFTGMPGWKDVIDEGARWKIVRYMRALADADKAAELERLLKERGKWEVKAPGDDHHHEEAERHDHELSGHRHEAGQDAEATYDVLLKEIGPDEINVIKEIRAITGLGLRDAKAIADAAPMALGKSISKQEAEQIEARLSELGANVEIRQSP